MWPPALIAVAPGAPTTLTWRDVTAVGTVKVCSAWVELNVAVVVAAITGIDPTVPPAAASQPAPKVTPAIRTQRNPRTMKPPRYPAQNVDAMKQRAERPRQLLPLPKDASLFG